MGKIVRKSTIAELLFFETGTVWTLCLKIISMTLQSFPEMINWFFWNRVEIRSEVFAKRMVTW